MNGTPFASSGYADIQRIVDESVKWSNSILIQTFIWKLVDVSFVDDQRTAKLGTLLYITNITGDRHFVHQKCSTHGVAAY